MLHIPHRLPDFDQAATDRRFLTELDRLLQAGAFGSYKELAATLGQRTGLFSEIESGRYHCNLKLIYTLVQHYPQADLGFILFPESAEAAPATVPVRARGRRRVAA